MSACSLDKRRLLFYFSVMVETATPEILPDIRRETEDKPKSGLESGYLVICWNDPINYMEYVTHVFRAIFGWPRKKGRVSHAASP